MSNLDRFKAALEDLAKRGRELEVALTVECSPKLKAELKAGAKDGKETPRKLPDFNRAYQSWYTEALALVKQVIPDRLSDFIAHYEAPRGRKELTAASYRIQDCLQGLQVSRGDWVVVARSAGLPHIQAQVEIVKAATARFESALFDIRQIVQADLFDSEIDAARALSKHGFARAAGAMAGVVLEHHLTQICKNRALTVTKKNPGISVLNDTLKNAEVIDVPQWRGIQRLGDIRNLCDHPKGTDPSKEQIDDLLDGVAKIVKTVF